MKFPFFAWAAELILLAGTTLLLIFIILSGSINHFPIDKFYWVEADTSSISGAPSMSRWTFWGLASDDDGSNNSTDLSPAYPFSPVDNFDTTENIPSSFVDNRDTYYYLSRFAFAFFFIALGFTGVTLMVCIFAMCSYSIVKLNGWFITIALLFDAGAVAFETAISVMGKSAFSSNGTYAKLGPALMGIAWASVACLILLFFISWGGLCAASYKKHHARVQANKSEQQGATTEHQDLPATTYDDPYAQQEQQQTAQGGALGNESGIKFFKIRRHNKDEDQESV